MLVVIQRMNIAGILYRSIEGSSPVYMYVYTVSIAHSLVQNVVPVPLLIVSPVACIWCVEYTLPEFSQ